VYGPYPSWTTLANARRPRENKPDLDRAWWVVSAAFVIVALMLLGFGAAPALAAAPVKNLATYHVIMSSPGTSGLKTDCSQAGYVATTLEKAGGTNLHGSGSDLNLDLFNTGVHWSRKYPMTFSGVFDGCYGVTSSSNGNLFIFFGINGGQSYVKFTWHFFYYLSPTVREHFTLQSGQIPFPAWTGNDISGRVTGSFDLNYYLKEGKTIVYNYVSLTGGRGVLFDFDLAVLKK